MRLLIIVLTFLWFTGWGLWFLNERGHFQNSDSGSIHQTDQNPAEDPDSLLAESTSDNHEFSFSHTLSSDSLHKSIGELIKERGENEVIQIISYYSELESYSGKEENLGIARSRKIIEQIPDHFPAEFFYPVGFLTQGDPDTTGISSYVKIKKADKHSPVHIFEDNRVVIFFPYASSNELAASKITSVIDSLSNIWKTEKYSLLVSGHTDNDASETTNYNLGLNRAQSIQERIVDAGFPAEKITTLSRGEKEPISSNLTSYGRYLNRRVEIYPFK